MRKQIAAGLLAVSLLFTGVCGFTLPETALVTEAAGKNVKISETQKTVALIPGQKAKLSIAKGRKITNSNPAVASADRKGIITTAALGTSKISYTGKKGKKRTLTVTVIPESEEDIDFIPEEAVSGRTIQARILCDKYDTSQLKVKYYDSWGNDAKEYTNGNITISSDSYGEYVYIKYGLFEKSEHIEVYSNKCFDEVPQDITTTLSTMDASAWAEDYEAVFNKAFEIVKTQTNNAMSEREKVKALHDYLIYHANYYNNGDYSDYLEVPWSYSASGVLLHGEGVCDSYAKAFYMLCKSAGMECLKVHGLAGGGGHAWNKVKVDGKWYYVDCTWDDPVGGGYERYDYFLSEELWGNHRNDYAHYGPGETAFDLATEQVYKAWDEKYFTIHPFEDKQDAVQEWEEILVGYTHWNEKAQINEVTKCNR